MEWIQFLIVVITSGSFLWMARSDYRHLDSKIDAMRKETSENMKGIREEMQDFHTRLAVQDAEFKAFMRNIEEKRNRILMGEK